MRKAPKGILLQRKTSTLIGMSGLKHNLLHPLCAIWRYHPVYLVFPKFINNFVNRGKKENKNVILNKVKDL